MILTDIDYNILALKSLNNNYKFTWGFPYNYEEIIWLDSRPQPTKEEWEKEKARLIAYQPKKECKDQAKQLLLESDWSEIPSVLEQLQNPNEWKSYRIEIRKYIINPVENPIFPTKPETIWKVK